MALKEITPEELVEKGVVSAPNILEGSPRENKLIFDRMAAELLAPAHNAAVRLVNDMEAQREGWDASEADRKSSETTRVGNEETRVAAEQARQEAESSRVLAENARVEAEGLRAQAEAARAEAENTRGTAEQQRLGNEETRVRSEEARTLAEQNRASAEVRRDTDESTRTSAESQRRQAEEARALAEAGRADAEQGRVTAEQGRQTAEANREAQETGYVAQARNAAADAKHWAEEAQSAAGGGVTTFNGRDGSVLPQKGDYTADMIGTYGAAPLDEGGKVPKENLPQVGLLPEILVTVPDGSRVTAKSGETTLTVENTTGGGCEFKCPDYGTWTVQATKGGEISDAVTVEATTVQQYPVKLTYFEATLIVTAEAQAQVTAASSGATYTGTCGPDGRCTLTIKKAGSYNIKARKNGADSSTTTADVSTKGSTYRATVTFLVLTVNTPSGSTVTATKAGTVLTERSEGDKAVFYLTTTGTWAVKATLNGDTAEGSVKTDSHRAYSLDLDYIHIYGVKWDGSSPVTWTRTDEAVGFVNPSPAVNNGNGSSPFDNIYPWKTMHREQHPQAGWVVPLDQYGLEVKSYGNGGLSVRIATKVTPEFPSDPEHADRGDGKGERKRTYVGAYHCGPSWKSQTGVKPKVSITHPAAWDGIHGLGGNVWMWDWATKWTIDYLYLVEFANWNSQATIGKGCGNNSAVENVGRSDGMKYVTGTSQSSRDTWGVGVKYRDIEGLWDNAYDWIGGCYYNSNGLNVVMNPNSYKPGQQSGGVLIGAVTAGWPSKFKVCTTPGYKWAIVPTEASGGETTHMSDGWYFIGSVPCLRVGGNYSRSGDRGLFYVSCNYASYSDDSISCRLHVLP